MQTAAPTPDGAGLLAFRAALGQFATGVTVVTTATADGPQGFTANSFASVSLDPPLILWSPARASSRFAVFAAAQSFSVHVLGADHLDLARRFVRGGAGFAGLPHDVTDEGSPILAGTLARFDCVRHAAHDGGDHLIIVGRVLRFATDPGAPLVFQQGQYGGFRSAEEPNPAR
jgi:flavin reductase (DIM6/NTAB) family NADH-FMN oxidoreductase RutF